MTREKCGGSFVKNPGLTDKEKAGWGGDASNSTQVQGATTETGDKVEEIIPRLPNKK